MDKIKTIIVRETEVIQGDKDSFILDSNYMELIPKNYIARYLRINLDFRNYRKVNAPFNPIVKINGELCPIPIQKDFELKTEDEFYIESLMINDEFYVGDITMILVNYGKNK